MVDNLDQRARSALMSRVRPASSKPEMIVRRLLHRLGFRYRLHQKALPGTPDIVFKSRKKAIFVHGCFWHRHPGCGRSTTPKTRTEFWLNKFASNVERDARVEADLKRQGWQVLVVWECQTEDTDDLQQRLLQFMDP